MLHTLLALAAVIAAGPSSPSSPSAKDRRYRALSTNDLDDLARVLRHRVAAVQLRIKKKDDLLQDSLRVVFAVVIDDKTVATIAQLCTDIEGATIKGPQGMLAAKLVLLDTPRRVALFRTEKPLASIGLKSSQPLDRDKRQVDADVFALVNTDPGAGVLQGVITQVGREPEYEGHPRTSLELSFGMPVFDAYTRWVGFARAVAWDRDRQMLIPPDKVRLARTATAAPAAAPEKPSRPWWAR